MDYSERHFQFQIAENENAYPPHVHYHGDFEVYYLREGSCRYFIDQTTYQLSAGDIVVIPPNTIHKVVYESRTHSRLLFNCSADYIPPSVLKHIHELTYFGHSPETEHKIESLFRHIRNAVERNDEFSGDIILCYVMQLFLTMARTFSENDRIPTDSSFVETAILYIRSNYATGVTLSETAAHCAVSPEHLSRVFKKETGFGFSEYLNIYRLKKAESLLKSGSDKSIAQVAALCGFNDSNYFSNAYKKMYGIPPSHVKRQTKKETEYVY